MNGQLQPLDGCYSCITAVLKCTIAYVGTTSYRCSTIYQLHMHASYPNGFFQSPPTQQVGSKGIMTSIYQICYLYACRLPYLYHFRTAHVKVSCITACGMYLVMYPMNLAAAAAVDSIVCSFPLGFHFRTAPCTTFN